MSEHGGIIVDGRQVATTLQCPHCGGHFLSIPGSGARRTFCIRCGQVTCGEKVCDVCIPIEARLEFVEGRVGRYTGLIQQLIGEGALILG